MLQEEHSAILLTCISNNCLENQFLVFLRVDVLHRFYCIITESDFKYIIDFACYNIPERFFENITFEKNQQMT